MEERERSGESRPESDGKERPSGSPSTPQITDKSGANRDSEDEDFAAKLDVSSDKFDPLLALYSPTVPLPYPNIKCFNNIAEYESFLKGGRGRAKPENVEKKQRKAMKGVADPERMERLRKLMVNNPTGEGSSNRTRRKHKPAKNVLTRMPLHTGSPLGELYRCVEERIRVKVHIRTFKGLRGVCSGFIVAFDKFWNLAMVDVDETYREPLLGEAFYHEKALTVTRLMEKLKIQESSVEGAGERKHKGKTRAFQHRLKAQTQSPASLPQAQAQVQAHTPATLPPPPGPPTTDNRARDTRKDPRKLERSVGLEPEQRPQKGASHPYGMVHTRHINQLFIRGENVLVVNLQPF